MPVAPTAVTGADLSSNGIRGQISDVASTVSVSSEVPSRVPKELREVKPWLTKKQFAELEQVGEPMPNEVFDHLVTILLFYCDSISEHSIFVMRPDVIAHNIDRKIVMTKSDLFDVIRRYYEFSAAKLLLIPYLWKENRQHDGHWLLFIVDLSCDTVFVFDSTNKFKGAESVLNEIRTCFIAPHLSYLREYDGPLDKPHKGKVKDDMSLAARAEEFKAVFLMTATRQTDNFSCGFRVAHAILRIILERCQPQSVVEAAAFDMEEYRRLII